MVWAVNAFQHAKATLDRRAAEAQQAQSVAEAELRHTQHQIQDLPLAKFLLKLVLTVTQLCLCFRLSLLSLQVRPCFQSRFLLVDHASSNITPVGDKQAVSTGLSPPGIVMLFHASVM